MEQKKAVTSVCSFSLGGRDMALTAFTFPLLQNKCKTRRMKESLITPSEPKSRGGRASVGCPPLALNFSTSLLIGSVRVLHCPSIMLPSQSSDQICWKTEQNSIEARGWWFPQQKHKTRRSVCRSWSVTPWKMLEAEVSGP